MTARVEDSGWDVLKGNWEPLPPELTLASHSLHDSGLLLQRWEELVAEGGLARTELAEDAGLALPILTLGEPGRVSLYLSAGMHGDEAVPPWALWHFVRSRRERLAKIGAFIVPLWNPDGLVNNRRTDSHGLDLNRQFHLRSWEWRQAWLAALEPWHFAAVMALHEDYDARGWYLYEISAGQARFVPLIRAALEGVMEPDLRAEIEEREADRGAIWAEDLPDDLPEWPEVFAFGGKTTAVLTFETPSEAGLEQRALAHLAVLEALLVASEELGAHEGKL